MSKITLLAKPTRSRIVIVTPPSMRSARTGFIEGSPDRPPLARIDPRGKAQRLFPRLKAGEVAHPRLIQAAPIPRSSPRVDRVGIRPVDDRWWASRLLKGVPQTQTVRELVNRFRKIIIKYALLLATVPGAR